MKNQATWFSVAAACLFGMNVHAQDAAPDETLLKSCAVCHGEEGISPSEDWPHLAGQRAGYLAYEMQAYRDGSRVHTEMNALAMQLTDEQIDALATYYASFPHAAPDLNDLSDDGQAGRNDAATCMACHGMHGLSATEIWPNLAGQTQTYIATQLKAFREGAREDPVMSPRAAGLSDKQIEGIAIYFSELGYR